MLEIGDVASLELAVTTAAGVAADATAVALTITLPDATSTNPSVSHPGVGSYTATYTTVQAGRHIARWVATGSNAAAQTQTFDVWPTDPRFILSLDEARAALNLATTDTSNNEELRLFIAAATLVIEDVVGPIIGTQSFSEQHHPNGSTLVLHRTRPVSFTSVVEYRSGSATTLTKAATPDVATSTQFTVDPTTSVLTRRAAGGAEYDFGDEVWVTYTAGTTSTPSNVLMAARELVAASYGQSQQAGHPAFGGAASTPDDTLVATPSGYLIPFRVMSWLEPSAVELGGFA